MFHHEALLYDGSAGFLSGTLPFIQDGLERGDAVLVAVADERIELLRDALGPSDVEFADVTELGRNPARIIPAWTDFLARRGRPARGVGEPVWPGRRGAELVETQLHEALLNVAFEHAPDFQLLCPYDSSTLDDAVLHEARCSHPFVNAQPSRAYRENQLEPFEAPLAPPPAHARVLGFELDSLADVRRLTAEFAAGLERVDDLVLAVAEAAANSVRHGGGRGILRIWRTEAAVICDIRDRGHIDDPLAGRRSPDAEQLGGRGLWIANRVCDLVQVRPGAVRLHMRAN